MGPEELLAFHHRGMGERCCPAPSDREGDGNTAHVMEQKQGQNTSENFWAFLHSVLRKQYHARDEKRIECEQPTSDKRGVMGKWSMGGLVVRCDQARGGRFNQLTVRGVLHVEKSSAGYH
jgi:hypothetical protein